MSFLSGVLTMAVTVGAAYLTGGASLAYSMATVFAVSTIASRIFAPHTPNSQNNNVRTQVPPDPTAGIPLVYGDAYTGGRFVDACLTTDNHVMYYVLAISCVSPNGQFSFDTTKFYYGDQLITFATDDTTRVASLTDGAGNVNTKINTNLNISLYTSDASGNITCINGDFPWGTSTNVMGVNSGLSSSQQWTSTGRRMNGTAFAIVRLNYNSDAGTTSLSPITFHCSQYLNSVGAALPGDVWKDYITNTVYGGAIDSSLVDTSSVTALNSYSSEIIHYTDSSGNPATCPRYHFNGVLDTGQTILSNIDIMMNCCDSWMQYNAGSGKFALVINKTSDVVLAFDDNNIIGNITTGTIDLNQAVNQVEAQFNDATNRDQAGYVNIKTPSYLLYPNEPVNKFSYNFTLLNDSVRAQYLANRILEQNREDLIISFNTTYAGIQVNAGDVVSVTNASYGWEAKLFRAMQVKEASLQDGTLGASLQLIEYNAAVYATADITQFQPSPNSGLVSATYFSALTSPNITDQQQNAAVPSFSVECFIPVTGRVTSVYLYYTTNPTPSTTDFNLLSVQNASDSQPFTNNSYLKFTHISLPTNVYYFAYKVANDISQSALSPLSTSFNWLPNPTTSAVAGTFIATFSPVVEQVPYQGSPSFTGIAPQLYGTTSGGSVDFVNSQSDSDSAFVNNSWRIGGSAYTGYSDIVKYNITIGNPTDGGNYAQFPQPTAMASNSASLAVPVRYKDSGGVVHQGATATLPFTFVFQGQSARICYSATSLTSLSPTPATITTSGNTSYPSDGSWGSDTHWVATAPTITAGQSVYQSDGVYNPVLDQTVWNVPYLSNLKVGQLSAISAIMGTLTSGTINTGSGSALLTMGSDANGSVWRLTRTTGTLLPPAYLIDNSYATTGGAPTGLWITQQHRSDGECLFINNGGGGEGIVISDPNNLNTYKYMLDITGSRQQGQTLTTAIGTGYSQHGGRWMHYDVAGGTLNSSGIAATEGGKAFYAEVGGYGPFTGVHDGLMPIGNAEYEIGDIVIDKTLIAKNGVSDTLWEVEQSTQPNQVAIGIYAGIMDLKNGPPASMIDKDKTISYDPVYDPLTGQLVSESYKNPPTAEYELIKDDYYLLSINAVGEGQLNVCGENGDIQRGDLIVTSSTLGKGMKQSDDLVHNYTVARAREAVTFSSPDEVKMIACVYLCG